MASLSASIGKTSPASPPVIAKTDPASPPAIAKTDSKFDDLKLSLGSDLVEDLIEAINDKGPFVKQCDAAQEVHAASTPKTFRHLTPDQLNSVLVRLRKHHSDCVDAASNEFHTSKDWVAFQTLSNLWKCGIDRPRP